MTPLLGPRDLHFSDRVAIVPLEGTARAGIRTLEQVARYDLREARMNWAFIIAVMVVIVISWHFSMVIMYDHTKLMSLPFIIAVIVTQVAYSSIYFVRLYSLARQEWRNEHQGEEGTHWNVRKRAHQLFVERLYSGDIGAIVAVALWFLWPLTCTALIFKLAAK